MKSKIIPKVEISNYFTKNKYPKVMDNGSKVNRAVLKAIRDNENVSDILRSKHKSLNDMLPNEVNEIFNVIHPFIARKNRIRQCIENYDKIIAATERRKFKLQNQLCFINDGEKELLKRLGCYKKESNEYQLATLNRSMPSRKSNSYEGLLNWVSDSNATDKMIYNVQKKKLQHENAEQIREYFCDKEKSTQSSDNALNIRSSSLNAISIQYNVSVCCNNIGSKDDLSNENVKILHMKNSNSKNFKSTVKASLRPKYVSATNFANRDEHFASGRLYHFSDDMKDIFSPDEYNNEFKDKHSKSSTENKFNTFLNRNSRYIYNEKNSKRKKMQKSLKKLNNEKNCEGVNIELANKIQRNQIFEASLNAFKNEFVLQTKETNAKSILDNEEDRECRYYRRNMLYKIWLKFNSVKQLIEKHKIFLNKKNSKISKKTKKHKRFLKRRDISDWLQLNYDYQINHLRTVSSLTYCIETFVSSNINDKQVLEKGPLGNCVNETFNSQKNTSVVITDDINSQRFTDLDRSNQLLNQCQDDNVKSSNELNNKIVIYRRHEMSTYENSTTKMI